MADTIKIFTLVISISLLLNLATTNLGNDKPFGQDVFDMWMARDTQGNYYGPNSTTMNPATSRIYEPSSATSQSGTSTLSFWDISQIVWGFIKLIFNVLFAIPYALLNFATIHPIIKFMIIIPLTLITLTVFIIRGIHRGG